MSRDTQETPGRPTTLVSRIVARVMPLLLLAGIFTVLVRRVAEPLSNFDTYFHLRFGHELLTDWSLRAPGSVSSFATADWVPTQWLPQVVMAWTEARLGLAGVAWLFGLQLCVLALTYYLVGRRWADPLPVAVVVILAVIASGPSLSMRPQVLSFVFVVLTVAAWLRVRERPRAPWWLIPTTWLWAMCHGMWPVGVVVGIVAATALVLDQRPSRSRAASWAAVPLLSLLAAGLTPVGPSLYAAVLLVNGRSEYFSEWQPLDFTTPPGIALTLLLVIGLGLGLRAERRDWTSTSLLLLALAWSLYSARTAPVAAAMLVPLAALALQGLLPPARPAPSAAGPTHSASRIGRPERGLVLGMFAAALVVLAVLTPGTSDEPPPQPGWVDRELEALAPGTPVLNEWGWGGYLMWRYPHLDLVMHGYGDTFTTAELDRNKAIVDLEPHWDRMVQETGARVALLPTDAPLAYALEQEEWRVVQQSEEVVMLAAPDDWPAEAP